MKSFITKLLTQIDRTDIERDIDEELRFHIESVTWEYVRQGFSLTEAKAKTLKRFGDVVEVKNECVQIRRRSRPFQRLVKRSLILLALAGLAIRFASTSIGFAHVGDMLIMIAVAGRLLLYTRALTPARFLPKDKTTLSLFTRDARH
jgi:hypothetical protein